MTTSQEIADGLYLLATKIKEVKTFINGNVADLSGASTTVKTNLIAMVNELDSRVDALAAGSGAIDDGATASSTTWSSQKTADEIAAAVTSILGGAGPAYDTLQELKALLDASDTADDSAIATLTTAIGNRLRFDAAQTLTAGEKVQANANLGSVSKAEFAPVDTDYVAIVESGLA